MRYNEVEKRIKVLENKVPSDLIIYAQRTDGEIIEARVKDVLNDDGTLKDGFCGVGNDGRIVVKGNNLDDIDRVLDSFTAVAFSEPEEESPSESDGVHNKGMPL